MELGTTIIIAFVIAWVLQYIMTYFQMRRYHKRLNELRKDGMLATGMSGSMYKRKTYGILVVDEQEKILHAEQLSGWTVFATLKPVNGLVGFSTKDIMDDSLELPVSKKIRSAFQNAVEQIEKGKEKKAEKDSKAGK